MKLLKNIALYLLITIGFIVAVGVGTVMASLSAALGMVILNRLFGINF